MLRKTNKSKRNKYKKRFANMRIKKEVKNL